MKNMAIANLSTIKPGATGGKNLRVRWDTWLVRTGFLLISFIILGGCASAPRTVPFQNVTHRGLYSLNEDDLKKVQFHISAEVVAHFKDQTGTRALFVPRMTPGVVTGAGPNWIKVSFREGGVDVPFVTDTKRNNGWYFLASEVSGAKGFKRISEIPENVFLYRGAELKVVSGADAYLLVDWESWKDVVETRKATGGRRVGGN